MTVIAWHGATKTLAADKRMTCHGYSVTVTKIFRRNDGALVGGSGVSDSVTEMIDWFLKGALASDFPQSCRSEENNRLLAITTDGRVWMYIRNPIPIEIREPFFAIGGGCDFALTAMHLGKNAIEAVRIACELDTACGNGVDYLQLNPADNEVIQPHDWKYRVQLLSTDTKTVYCRTDEEVFDIINVRGIGNYSVHDRDGIFPYKFLKW